MPSFGLEVSCLCNPIPAPRLEGEGYGWPFPLQPPLPCLSQLTGPQTPGPAPCLGVFYRHTHPICTRCLASGLPSCRFQYCGSPLPSPPGLGESPAAIFLGGQAGRACGRFQQSQPPLLQVDAEALAVAGYPLHPPWAPPLGRLLGWLRSSSSSAPLVAF